MRFNFLSTVLAGLVFCTASVGFAHNHNHDHGHNHSHDHGHHHHTAPHGGTLVVLGDEAAHVELVLDAATGSLTAFVLDGEAEKAIRIAQENLKLHIGGRDVPTTFTMTLNAIENPLTGEKKGNTSQFGAAAHELKGKGKFTVTLESITLRGVTFKNTTSPFPEGNH